MGFLKLMADTWNFDSDLVGPAQQPASVAVALVARFTLDFSR